MTFNLVGPLPTGTTVLEASAGTGKTYVIVGLAVRYVAEGVADISQLLLVTFSRAATRELRERTRQRFVDAAHALSDPESARAGTDPLLAFLASGEDAEVQLRRRRLLQALANFDAATIATTHGFCERSLAGLGIAGEDDSDVQFVESVIDLAQEVAEDIYLQTYANDDCPPAFELKDARKLAIEAVSDRHAVLMPDADSETVAGHRVKFCAAVREEVDRRKKLMGIRDFDDLQALLHGVLTDPQRGETACRRLRERYSVVLVDEFQDTDPVQWGIFEKAFHGNCTLILVGDPKQAIYAFRGAEVLSYLDAVRHADRYEDLGTNWRTDAPLIAALDHLYGGAELGHAEIVVRQVQAHHRDRRLSVDGDSAGAPLRLRYLPRTGMGPLGTKGFPSVVLPRKRIARDVASDIARLLGGRTSLTEPGGSRPIGPGDIAVLTRTSGQMELVRDALGQAGVPSVLSGGKSVFETPSAEQWLWVLQALEQPHRIDRVRLAALTPLIGKDPHEFDADDDEAVGRLSGWLRELSAIFTQIGFAAVAERISTETQLERRMLELPSGERTLTDIRHLAQLLGEVSSNEAMGVAELIRWLTQQRENPVIAGSDRSRRLDSDADAVQIMTAHSSKGLGFPVVYVPYAWDAAAPWNPLTRLLHDDDGTRILDVGGKDAAGARDRANRAEEEDGGDALRLLYVAATRARCQLVLWWAPSASTAQSALHRLVFGRSGGTSDMPTRVKVPADEQASRHIEAWAAPAADLISVEPVSTRASSEPAGRYTQDSSDAKEPAAATFTRSLDLVWRRTSYSALTSGAHDHVVIADIEEQGITDEPEEVAVTLTESEPATGIASPMNAFPGGTAFGTLVHEILEHVDTSTGDLAAELTRSCTEAVAAHLADIDPEALADALHTVMQTPMQLVPGQFTLASVSPRDLLPELDFEIPLAGGDTPTAQDVMLRDIAVLIERHLPAEDPLAEYPELLRTVESAPLRGYLTGSIDAVIRCRDDVGGASYVVVDYKTNRLGTGDLTTAHYTRERMAQEMMHSHYVLQALLYSVALHRYLRWRQPGYDPSSHLGGIGYLFVRGMVGPETPANAGVFDWRPPTALVMELSDLLAGQETS
ncbi:MAG: UvrD-helicase domain-containing protein [Rhodococcus sp.]|nr:UvrD-helicase domain-containing protein [Rhodococcus sp. (in: high G+C Gram-positive bacteria)]